MNRFLTNRLSLLAVVAWLFATNTSCVNSLGDRDFVILSTNDMHAQIAQFPALASAIKECRDTTDVILVDAGDRWTGNAFVDLVDYYAPMYELMNMLKYDVAIYGNHEFDKGQDYLAVSNRQAQFPIICANVQSQRASFPQPASHTIIDVDGKKIAFVGVVGNYEAACHPAGKSESYEGLTFEDPHSAASKFGYLADECDMVVLVSHSGLDRDVEFVQSGLAESYDQIISAHSHDVASEQVNGTLITQTGSRLKNIGATKVTITSKGEVILSHSNIPLSLYEPDEQVGALVAKYYNNPDLNAPIGSAAADFNRTALKNLFASTIRGRVGADIGLYHNGGVRIDELSEGEISMATILNAEPFNSYIATAVMTVAQLREMVITKFNDKRNVGESHYIDLVTTTPYTIITDESGDAVDVIFPELKADKRYKVAMGDYIFKTYGGLNYSSGAISEILITEALLDCIGGQDAIVPNSNELQNITDKEPQQEPQTDKE